MGGGGTDVQQAPTHTQSWGQLEQALAGMAVPEIGGMELAQPEYYGGERLAGMDPNAMTTAQNAMSGMAGGMMDFYDPIYDAAMNRWNQEIAPSVMERFAGMGNAMSGGAASALSREGENLMTDISAQVAPLYQEAIFNMPQLASWEQDARQRPLDIERQQWLEKQPYSNPYAAFGRDVLSGGGANAMENYAEQGTDWASIGGNLGSSAILARGLAKSDRRLKENIEPIENALAKVKDLHGYTFTWKSTGARDAGVIAQEVEGVLPEGVEDISGFKAIRLPALIGLLIEALNELADEVVEIRSSAVLN